VQFYFYYNNFSQVFNLVWNLTFYVSQTSHSVSFLLYLLDPIFLSTEEQWFYFMVLISHFCFRVFQKSLLSLAFFILFVDNLSGSFIREPSIYFKQMIIPFSPLYRIFHSLLQNVNSIHDRPQLPCLSQHPASRHQGQYQPQLMCSTLFSFNPSPKVSRSNLWRTGPPLWSSFFILDQFLLLFLALGISISLVKQKKDLKVHHNSDYRVLIHPLISGCFWFILIQLLLLKALLSPLEVSTLKTESPSSHLHFRKTTLDEKLFLCLVFSELPLLLRYLKKYHK